MRIATVSEMPLARVAMLERDDLRFSYDDKAPHWQVEPALAGHSYRRREEVDPWGPAYTHDEDLVAKLLVECVRAAPLVSAPTTVYIVLWEGLARTNGWSTYDHPYMQGEVPATWGGPGPKPWEGAISLSGKRIELHPAVTRYLVAHEYGHLVDTALALLRWPGDGNAFGKLHDEYRKLRRLDNVTHYGNGTHHLDVAEVFANDFRTVVLERERDFWAHPVTPGWKLKRVIAWWENAIAALQDATKRAAA